MLKQQFQSALTDSFVIFTGVGQVQYDTLGDIRLESGGSGIAEYKFVKFSGTLTSAVGDFCCYTDATLTIVDGTNAAVPAGLAQCAITAGTPLVGWIQTKGKATLNTAYSGAPAAGNKVTNAGAANKTLKVSAAVTDAYAGTALNATTGVQLTCGM